MFETEQTCFNIEMTKIAKHDTEIDIVTGNIQLRDEIAKTVTDESHRIKSREPLLGLWRVVAQEIQVTGDRPGAGIFSGAKSDSNAKAVTSRVANFST